MGRKKLTSRSAKPTVTVRKTEPAGIRWLDCKECNMDGAYCSLDVKAVTCASCVAKQAAPPETPKHLQVKTDDEKRPRGWQFMKEYISPSGKIFHKGKEVDDADRHVVRTVRKGKADSIKPNAKKSVSGTGRKRGRPKSNPATDVPRKRGRPRKLS